MARMGVSRVGCAGGAACSGAVCFGVAGACVGVTQGQRARVLGGTQRVGWFMSSALAGRM